MSKEVVGETAIDLRRKGKQRAKITTEMRLEIALKVAIEYELVADVAKEYGVTSSCISRIVSTMRKDPADIVDRVKKESAESLTDEALAAFVDAKLLEGKLI